MHIITRCAKKKVRKTKKGPHTQFKHADRITTVSDGVIRTTWECVCASGTCQSCSHGGVGVKLLGRSMGFAFACTLRAVGDSTFC